jgi:hypothetical protein
LPAARPTPTELRAQAPRLGRPVTIGVLSGKAAAPALGKRGLAGGQLIAHWASVVGDELAALACPLEIKFPQRRNDGATLIVRVASGAAATLLQMKTPVILERVNAFFGYRAVSRIQPVQGPIPRQAMTRVERPVALPDEARAAVAREVQDVGSEKLKAALLRLGESLARRRHRSEGKN